MNTLSVLFLQINLAWAAGYLLYRLCRGKDTFFRLRRCLLLGVDIFALAFPWLSAHWPARLLHDMSGGNIPEIRLQPVGISPDPATDLSVSDWLWTAYAAIAAVLLLRIAVRVGSFIRFARRCPKESQGGQHFHRLPEGMSPFSFFGRMFLPASVAKSPYATSVIAHESVHIRQHHSADMLFLQTACAVFWPNPAVWLTLHEMLELHEYLADEEAMSAVSPREYQLALLGISSNKVATPLTNNFNVLPLKKRIKMMTTQKTSILWQTKYLLLVPASLCLLAFGHTAFAAPGTAEPDRTALTAAQNHNDNLPDNASADVPARYAKGEAALMQFIASNTKYPADAMKKNIQGTTVIGFTVDKTGRVTDVKVKKSLSPSCDAEAVRVVKLIKDFIPAKKNRKPIAVKMVLPFRFAMQPGS